MAAMLAVRGWLSNFLSADLVGDPLRQLLSSALPQRCLFCRQRAAAGVCDGCAHELPWLPDQHCSICALPLTEATVCGACLQHPPAFDRAVAAFVYAFPVDTAIRALKYQGKLSASTPLAEQLCRALREAPRPDLVLPMPLATGRLRERGFNQALELARMVARKFDLPLQVGACVRIRETAPQTALPWSERARNIRGAFACSADLHQRHVAVIDDVLTTGATMNEVARTLRQAGAAEVSAWVLARTPHPNSPT